MNALFNAFRGGIGNIRNETYVIIRWLILLKTKINAKPKREINAKALFIYFFITDLLYHKFHSLTKISDSILQSGKLKQERNVWLNCLVSRVVEMVISHFHCTRMPYSLFDILNTLAGFEDRSDNTWGIARSFFLLVI